MPSARKLSDGCYRRLTRVFHFRVCVRFNVLFGFQHHARYAMSAYTSRHVICRSSSFSRFVASAPQFRSNSKTQSLLFLHSAIQPKKSRALLYHVLMDGNVPSLLFLPASDARIDSHRFKERQKERVSAARREKERCMDRQAPCSQSNSLRHQGAQLRD